MTIQEAINSGKKFKRPYHVSWMKNAGEHSSPKFGDNDTGYHCSIMDILAHDWEIETHKLLAYKDNSTHQLYMFPNEIKENERGYHLITRVPHLDQPK